MLAAFWANCTGKSNISLLVDSNKETMVSHPAKDSGNGNAAMAGLIKSGIDLYIPIPENVIKHELVKRDNQIYFKYSEDLICVRKRKQDDEYFFRT